MFTSNCPIDQSERGRKGGEIFNKILGKQPPLARDNFPSCCIYQEIEWSDWARGLCGGRMLVLDSYVPSSLLASDFGAVVMSWEPGT
jgi:hypothetical protein